MYTWKGTFEQLKSLLLHVLRLPVLLLGSSILSLLVTSLSGLNLLTTAFLLG